jgi:hypothetical protein
MRVLKINKGNISPRHRVIGWEDVTIENTLPNGLLPLRIKTRGKHNLKREGNMILLLEGGTMPFEKQYHYEVIDEVTLIIYIPEYIKIEVENYSSIEDNALLEPVSENIHTLVKNVNDITLKYSNNVFNGHVYYSYDDEGNPTNEEDAASRSIMCDASVGFTGRGFVEIKNNWFINDGIFDNNIVLEEDDFAIEIPISLQYDPSYRLNDEKSALNGYFDAVKASIIPEIIDNEKRQFIPIVRYSKQGSFLGEKYKPVKEIEFNLHLRNRYDTDLNNGTLREGWRTTDEQLWNGFKENAQVYKVNGYNDNYADELNAIGFTEDDIRFAKTKVGKSFIRLMFYSSKDMMKKELLSYSTVYLDPGELYHRYCEIKSRGLQTFDEYRLDDKLRLSAKFLVRGKYTSNKSSEGFYLYLFPSEIESESLPRTIYMKVEFNHAGYGKTVPLMLPRDSNGNVITSTSSKFPIDFNPAKTNGNGKTEVDFDFEGYQDAVMIPLEIWFSEELNQYVYHFPFTEDNDGRIILNLFEPRIRGDK